MGAVVFIFLVFIVGFIISEFFLGVSKRRYITLVRSFVIGSIISVTFVYCVASLIHSLVLALVVYGTCVGVLCVLRRKQIRIILQFLSGFTRWEIGFLAVALVFSWYIFTQSFSYDVSTGSFLISSHVYLDFGARIPFIRSFSLGNNFPMEVPFFAGTGLLYHMFFDCYAGILEFLGLRIDIAENVISSLSFALLLIAIYECAKQFFQNTVVGILSVLFFLLPSDISFISIFKQDKLNIAEIWQNAVYRYNGPQGHDTISLFWSLNTYLNQRHLIFGILFAVFFIQILFEHSSMQNSSNKKIICLGILLGIFPLWHISIFIAVCMMLVFIILLMPTLRVQSIKILILAGIISAPQLFLIHLHSSNSVMFHPGFLMSAHPTIPNIMFFWVWNLGIAFITIFLGFFVVQKKELRIFFLIIFLLFIFPNLFQFGQDMYDNHKFFNLWIVFANMFSAVFLVFLFRKNIYLKLLSVMFFLLLIASGCINFLVIKNNTYIEILDFPYNAFLSWTESHIPSDDIIITNGGLYDPMSLIGKRVFLGYSYFIFQYGGDTTKRMQQESTVLSGKNLSEIHNIIHKNSIGYLVFYKKAFTTYEQTVNLRFFEKNFHKEFENKDGIVFKIE